MNSILPPCAIYSSKPAVYRRHICCCFITYMYSWLFYIFIYFFHNPEYVRYNLFYFNSSPFGFCWQGGLLVAPILQVLLLNRDPVPVLDWADRVSSWPFKRVIPCHLANDVTATPKDFRNAFRFLEKPLVGSGRGGLMSVFGWGGAVGGAQPLAEDLQFLRDAEKTLVELGTLFPAAEPVVRSRR